MKKIYEIYDKNSYFLLNLEDPKQTPPPFQSEQGIGGIMCRAWRSQAAGVIGVPPVIIHLLDFFMKFQEPPYVYIEFMMVL